VHIAVAVVGTAAAVEFAVHIAAPGIAVALLEPEEHIVAGAAGRIVVEDRSVAQAVADTPVVLSVEDMPVAQAAGNSAVGRIAAPVVGIAARGEYIPLLLHQRLTLLSFGYPRAHRLRVFE